MRQRRNRAQLDALKEALYDLCSRLNPLTVRSLFYPYANHTANYPNVAYGSHKGPVKNGKGLYLCTVSPMSHATSACRTPKRPPKERKQLIFFNL